jgi:hypothetical protein
VDPVVQAPWHLVVDLRTEPGQAAERGLDMAARATETVVKIEVAKGSIQVIPPHQANNAPAKPDAFRIAGRTVDRVRGFSKFIGPALVVLGGIGIPGGGLAGLILGGRSALGQGTPNTDHECQPGDSEVPKNCNLKLKHPLTHEFPDLVAAGLAATQMPFN